MQAELGYEVATMADTGNYFGMSDFIDECRTLEIPFFIGVERFCETGDGHNPVPVTIYPKNDESRVQLYELPINASVSIDELDVIAENAVIFTRGNQARFQELIREHDTVFPAIDNPDHHSLEYGKLLSELFDKTVIAHEVRMAKPEELVALQFALREKELVNRRIPTKRLLNHTLKSPFELYLMYPNHAREFGRTQEIAQSIRQQYPEQPRLNARNVLEGLTPEQTVTALVERGLEQRTDNDALLQERIQAEMQIIKARQNWSDFFLIVADVADHCRKAGINLNVSGSATHSMVLNLLGVSQIDAREFDYRRFLNPEREGVPDIDLGLSKTDQSKVYEYLSSRYETFVAISIVEHLRLKTIKRLNAEDGLGFSDGEMQAVAQANLPWEYGKHNTKYTWLVDVPLWEWKGIPVAQINKDQLDDMGRENLDLLRQSSLTVKDAIVEQLKERGLSTEVVQDDPRVMKSIFKELRLVGRKNIESPHMHNVISALGKIKDTFTVDDIALALSLARPGNAILRRFTDKNHPRRSQLDQFSEFAEVIGKTNSTIVHQEQVMQIATDVAGLSMAVGDKFKKMMAAKVTNEERNYLANLLSQSLLGKGFPENIVTEIVDQVDVHRYSFLQGHSVELAQAAYDLAYFAEYFPSLFWEATLRDLAEFRSHKSYPYSIQVYVNEALRDGMKFIFPTGKRRPQLPELVEDTIIIGDKLLQEQRVTNSEYRAAMIDLLDPQLSREDKIRSQLDNLGVSFIDNPMILYPQTLYFDPENESQWIVGHVEGIKRGGARKDTINPTDYVVLESGKRLNVAVSRLLQQKKKEGFEGKFWYVRLVKNEQLSGRLEIVDVKPLDKIPSEAT